VADRLDRELAAEALRKKQRGEKPTRDELRALRRVEAAREEELRWQYYATIPKGHWEQMSGRHVKVINEQADRYDIPLRGKTIDLPAVVKRIHDFLAEKKYVLTAAQSDSMTGAVTPALEKWREAKAQLARMDVKERKGVLLRREDVHDWLVRLGTIMRGAADRLQREFGKAALTILEEALQDYERELEQCVGSEDHGTA